jgi:hypothetical protein
MRVLLCFSVVDQQAPAPFPKETSEDPDIPVARRFFSRTTALRRGGSHCYAMLGSCRGDHDDASHGGWIMLVCAACGEFLGDVEDLGDWRG